MTVAGCELRRGDDGAMSARRLKRVVVGLAPCCRLTPPFPLLSPFPFARVSAYAIIAFTLRKANSGVKEMIVCLGLGLSGKQVRRRERETRHLLSRFSLARVIARNHTETAGISRSMAFSSRVT